MVPQPLGVTLHRLRQSLRVGVLLLEDPLVHPCRALRLRLRHGCLVLSPHSLHCLLANSPCLARVLVRVLPQLLHELLAALLLCLPDCVRTLLHIVHILVGETRRASGVGQLSIESALCSLQLLLHFRARLLVHAVHRLLDGQLVQLLVVSLELLDGLHSLLLGIAVRRFRFLQCLLRTGLLWGSLGLCVCGSGISSKALAGENSQQGCGEEVTTHHCKSCWQGGGGLKLQTFTFRLQAAPPQACAKMA
mmetsp:Transcript_51390/g.122131  ORF Transcript_51390/g.122131 Transcript_51390/m.122131 type:complete len:249 (-) Transcript_51390:7-753(-)